MINLKKVGFTIECLRKSKQMTQEDLASALFVSRQAVSKWETGKGIPSLDIFVELTKLFDVSIDALLDGVELSKKDYVEQFNQLPRVVVFTNFIESKNLKEDVKNYLYLFNEDERAQLINLLITNKITLPYTNIWPYLSEDERQYLFGYILTNRFKEVNNLLPYLNQVERQMLHKKYPNKFYINRYNRKEQHNEIF